MQKETWSERLRRERREGERELSGVELEIAEEAWAKGRAEGWAQVQAEMAAKLIRLGQMPLEAIAEVVDLPIERLREIKKNLSHPT